MSYPWSLNLMLLYSSSHIYEIIFMVFQKKVIRYNCMKISISYPISKHVLASIKKYCLVYICSKGISICQSIRMMSCMKFAYLNSLSPDLISFAQSIFEKDSRNFMGKKDNILFVKNWSKVVMKTNLFLNSLYILI